jgi:hypothetical protein
MPCRSAYPVRLAMKRVVGVRALIGLALMSVVVVVVAVMVVPTAWASSNGPPMPSSGPPILTTTILTWCATQGSYCYGTGVILSGDGSGPETQASYGGMLCDHADSTVSCEFATSAKYGPVSEVCWEESCAVPADAGSSKFLGSLISYLQFKVTGVTRVPCIQTMRLTVSSGTETLQNDGYITPAAAQKLVSSKGRYAPTPSVCRLTGPRPGVTVTNETIHRDGQATTADFLFTFTHPVVTDGAQCAYALRGSRHPHLYWSHCQTVPDYADPISGSVQFGNLGTNRSFMFYVKARNSLGFGKTTAYRFVA